MTLMFPGVDTVPVPSSDELEQFRIATRRLAHLEAVVRALDRREEVSALIAASDDVASALIELAAFLGTDQDSAHGVLTLHWSAFTRARHRQAVADLAEMRHVVAEFQQRG